MSVPSIGSLRFVFKLLLEELFQKSVYTTDCNNIDRQLFESLSGSPDFSIVINFASQP